MGDSSQIHKTHSGSADLPEVALRFTPEESFLAFVLKRAWLTVILMGLGGYAGSQAVQKFPPQYGYVALIEVANFGTLDTTSRLLKRQKRRDPLEPYKTAILTDEILSYLKFRYSPPKIKLPLEKATFLKDVQASEENQRYIEITARAPSLDEANAFLDAILKDLQEQAAPKLSEIREETAHQLEALKVEEVRITTGLDRIRVAIEKLGNLPELLTQESSLRELQAQVASDQTRIRGLASDDRLRNFRFISIKPETSDGSPSFPSPPVFAVGGVAAGIVLSVLLSLLIEIFWWRRPQ